MVVGVVVGMYSRVGRGSVRTTESSALINNNVREESEEGAT